MARLDLDSGPQAGSIVGVADGSTDRRVGHPPQPLLGVVVEMQRKPSVARIDERTALVVAEAHLDAVRQGLLGEAARWIEAELDGPSRRVGRRDAVVGRIVGMTNPVSGLVRDLREIAGGIP